MALLLYRTLAACVVLAVLTRPADRSVKAAATLILIAASRYAQPRHQAHTITHHQRQAPRV